MASNEKLRLLCDLLYCLSHEIDVTVDVIKVADELIEEGFELPDSVYDVSLGKLVDPRCVVDGYEPNRKTLYLVLRQCIKSWSRMQDVGSLAYSLQSIWHNFKYPLIMAGPGNEYHLFDHRAHEGDPGSRIQAASEYVSFLSMALKKSAQQGDAPEPATIADPASPSSQPPAR